MVTGKVTDAFGTDITGFEITTNWGGNGPIFDPSSQVRNYEDIEKILGRNQVPYKTHEETTSTGKFKSYSVATG